MSPESRLLSVLVLGRRFPIDVAAWAHLLVADLLQLAAVALRKYAHTERKFGDLCRGMTRLSTVLEDFK